MPNTRVLLRITPEFTPPNYVRAVRYVQRAPSLCSCELDEARVDELRQHAGVVGLSSPRARLVVRAPRER
jgi:hypothetical protein